MRLHGRPRRSEGYFGPKGRRPKAGIGGPALVEGVLTPISSRIISNRLDLYKRRISVSLYPISSLSSRHLDPLDPPPPSEYEALHPFILLIVTPEFIILPLCDCQHVPL